MAQSLLEELKREEPPRPPVKLREQVRTRVNTTLLWVQLADFVLRGLPYTLTFTGSYEPRPKGDARRE
jgi:hypothetical protein